MDSLDNEATMAFKNQVDTGEQDECPRHRITARSGAGTQPPDRPAGARRRQFPPQPDATGRRHHHPHRRRSRIVDWRPVPLLSRQADPSSTPSRCVTSTSFGSVSKRQCSRSWSASSPTSPASIRPTCSTTWLTPTSRTSTNTTTFALSPSDATSAPPPRSARPRPVSDCLPC